MLEYQLLKNTCLNLSYYWAKPIESIDKHNPYNDLLIELLAKF
jgi:hypothetical protein